MAESERQFRTIVDAGIESAHDIANKITVNAEPIATVTLWADRVSQIGLPLVVERDNIGIGNKSGFMLVFNLDCGSREDKTEMARRAGVLKGRVAGMATKCADADGAVVENNLVELADIRGAHPSCYRPDRGQLQAN